MLFVNIADKPSLSLISKKFQFILDKIIDFSIAISKAFNCEIHGFYLRGSIPRGLATKYSDIDLDIILSEKNSMYINEFRYCLVAWYSTHYWWCKSDFKFFVIDSQHRFRSLSYNQSTNLPLIEIVRRNIVFDFLVNGVCIFGKEIDLSVKTFDSFSDFKDATIYIWNNDVKLLLDFMNNNENFNKYYALIKRLIKLCAYISLESQGTYYYSVIDCYQYILRKNSTLEQDFTMLYSYYKSPFEDVNVLKNAINKIYYSDDFYPEIQRVLERAQS